jgi:hypothetical protein
MKRTVTRLLGDRALGMLDYYRHPKWRASWGGAFNGQQHRQLMVETFLRRLPLDGVVETGTFRGTTTAYLASLTPLPIYTVERDPRLQGFGLSALWRFKNVHRFGGDCREFLRMLGANPGLHEKSILFYLDAHWGDDLPLAEELEIVCNQWRRAVVLIDDFQVPDDAGYGYDDYGHGKSLTFEYIEPAARRFDLHTFYPSLPSTSETGARRGSVTLAADPSVLRLLRTLPVIRELEHEDGQ